MSVIKDEEAFYQNLKNLSYTYFCAYKFVHDK